MKPIYYRKLGKDPRAAMINCSQRGNRCYIGRINTPEPYRGRGIASELLRECIADADAEGVTLHLDIAPSGSMDHFALKCWYERYGFEEIPTEGIYTIWERKPKVLT